MNIINKKLLVNQESILNIYFSAEDKRNFLKTEYAEYKRLSEFCREKGIINDCFVKKSIENIEELNSQFHLNNLLIMNQIENDLIGNPEKLIILVATHDRLLTDLINQLDDFNNDVRENLI